MGIFGLRRVALPMVLVVAGLLLSGIGSAASADPNGSGLYSFAAAVGPLGSGGDGVAVRNGSTAAPPCVCVGRPGPRGRPGTRGPRGRIGVRGQRGATGLRGLRGATGVTGATGPIGLSGSTGASGPTGLIGPIGLTGSTGATGPTGTDGVNGDTGPTGATGADGPTGATGVTGAAGAAAPSEYAYIYNLDAQVVPLNADVTFSTNGPIGSTVVSHAPGTDTITVNTPGVYEINFSVSGVEPNQFTVFVNGIPVPGSTYGSGAGTQLNAGMTIVSLLAGDAVTLRNFTSAAAVTLQTLAGGTEVNVNASIMFQRLSS
jgi:hypothetical protein